MKIRSNEIFYILIPTRERPDTLLHCLRTVVSQDYPHFRVIVSDNFSQDNTAHIVASLKDDRIQYTNTQKRIGMSNNFEHALSLSGDGWVTILGDDDGLLPGALSRVADIAKTTGAEAINSRWCQYYWPGLSNLESTLTVPFSHGWEWRNSALWLSKLMKGEVEYPELPMLYTGGFIRSSAINRARDQNGIFFRSINPDVFSAIAIASTVENYVYLKEPVAIAGISNHSNGASCLGIGNEPKPAENFFSENTIEFHPKLTTPRTKSIPIIVYESYLQSIALHRDILNICLVSQLSLAIAHSPRESEAEIVAYCSTVAKANNIDQFLLSRTTIATKRRQKIRWLFQVLQRHTTWFIKKSNATYDAKLLGISNVFEASLAARAVWVNQAESSGWRSKKVAGFLRRVAHWCFNGSHQDSPTQ